MFFPPVSAPPPGKAMPLSGIAGAGDALLVSELARHWRRPILFITRDTLSAYHLAEEISFFAPKLSTRLLPDWEVLLMILFRRPHRQLVPALQHWPVLLTEKRILLSRRRLPRCFLCRRLNLLPPEFLILPSAKNVTCNNCWPD